MTERCGIFPSIRCRVGRSVSRVRDAGRVRATASFVIVASMGNGFRRRARARIVIEGWIPVQRCQLEERHV